MLKILWNVEQRDVGGMMNLNFAIAVECKWDHNHHISGEPIVIDIVSHCLSRNPDKTKMNHFCRIISESYFWLFMESLICNESVCSVLYIVLFVYSDSLFN